MSKVMVERFGLVYVKGLGWMFALGPVSLAKRKPTRLQQLVWLRRGRKSRS